MYSEPGAFTASIGWYRVGTGGLGRVLAEHAPRSTERITVPTTALWPDHDPLFPPAWSNRLDQFYADIQLRHVDCGHFLPLERPDEFAAAVADAAGVTTA